MGFFKAYDMRGTFGVDFDLDTVYKVGKALPLVVKGGRWLVGRDCRVTSAAVRDALVKGLAESGAEVTDIGLCTTPMVYYFTATDGYDGSVMITASHNPPSDNGLKVSMKTALPVGYANGLNEVEKKVGVGSGSGREVGVGSGSGSADVENCFISRYIDFLKQKLDSFVPLPLSTPTSSLRIGIDCSNGMASLLVHEIFPDAVVINDTLDGSFPNHSPNPLKADAREQISALVREKKLDCGIIFDGDADRAMFVDENGDFVQPDYLIPIIARAVAGSEEVRVKSEELRNKVLHDVRTSRGAIETIREMGCEPVMVPVGHAFAKPRMRETGAICGGELAGHYYFREFFGCDSAFLAVIHVLSEFAASRGRSGYGESADERGGTAASRGRSGYGESADDLRMASDPASPLTFSEMMKPIISRYANSGELNFKVEDKDAAIARVLKCAAGFGEETGRSEMDGVRVEFAAGWINVRKSNTEPYLRLIVEAKTKELMEQWVSALSKEI